MGIVKIRLIGDRESVHSVASRVAPRLRWTEYPLYKDQERTQVDEHRIALYATIRVKHSANPKTMTLDQYSYA